MSREIQTVGELIEELQHIDPNVLVRTPGFDENGFEPVILFLQKLYKFGENDFRESPRQALVSPGQGHKYELEPPGVKTPVLVINFV